MESLIEHGLLALGVGVVAATVFGFVIAHAVEEAMHTETTATRFVCIGILVLAVFLLAGVLKAQVSGCPREPEFAGVDTRTYLCQKAYPAPQFPRLPTPGSTFGFP